MSDKERLAALLLADRGLRVLDEESDAWGGPLLTETGALDVAARLIAAGVTLSPEGARAPRETPRCTQCKAVATQRDIDGDWWPPCSCGIGFLKYEAEVSAPRPDALEAIRMALSEDGVIPDDAPDWFNDHEATAWADGYEAGQESVQQHLDAFKPAGSVSHPSEPT